MPHQVPKTKLSSSRTEVAFWDEHVYFYGLPDTGQLAVHAVDIGNDDHNTCQSRTKYSRQEFLFQSRLSK